jgi:integrase
MANGVRQQLPPQIKKVEVKDRRTGSVVIRYQLTVDAGTDPQTGRRRQVRRRYATQKQAREALAEIGQQAATGQFVPRRAITVEELAADWLASLHNTRATTRNGYVYDLAPLREQYGHLPVQKLTRPDLDKLLIALRDGGTTTAKGRKRRAWSPRSLNKCVERWRMLLDYGVERRELPHNVAERMRKVPNARPNRPTYDADEINLVLRAADKDRSGHLWWLALNGLRRGELAGLKWSDIDLDAATVSVDRVRVAAGAGVVVENGPKPCSSRRTLPLDDGLAAVLRRASARYAQERLAFGAAHTDSGYVASNEIGEPYTPDTLSRKWNKLTKSAGVKSIRLHDARHSCGTAMHLRGTPTVVIAEWLGHADAETTSRIYVHSQKEFLLAAAKTLGAVVTSS